jgi:hypothetical protein
MKTIAQQLNIKKFPFIIKDDDGQEIYREWSNGVWLKQEWAGGKVIRWEDSSGFWEKREYADGQMIRYEDSKGFWQKWEYAGGEMIYWENSDGVIRDNRPKTDIQKAIDLLTKEGLIVDGKILKN